MKLKILFRLAFKNLWLHRLRTTLTITGVTIGIGSIIFLVSLGYGLEKLVTDQVANFDAFTVLDIPAANLKTLKIDQQSIDKISSFGHIKIIAGVTNIAGRVKKEEKSSTTETVVMAAKEDYWKLANIQPITGQLPKNKDEIMLNEAVISIMGEDKTQIVGKTVDLDIIIPPELQDDNAVKTAEYKEIPLKVVGITDDSKEPIVFIHTDLIIAHEINRQSSLKLKVDDRGNVEALRKQLENIGFSTEYVGDTVSEISRVFSFFRFILATFGLIALIVAALGTFNTLTISLLERTREVGLFKALGMKNRDIYKLFLTESLIIGLCGGLVGLALGTFLGSVVDATLRYLAQKSGAEPINIFLTPYTFSLSVAFFSIFIGFITGWYPAKRAVKINPLDALRFE